MDSEAQIPSSTLRARRTRERQKRGLTLVQFELKTDEIDAFIKSGFITEAERNNRERLGFAVEQVLGRWMAYRRH